MKWLVVLVALSATFPAAAGEFTHSDRDGLPLKGTAPIYFYSSAGAGQFNLAVGTNTKLTVPPTATLAEICVATAAVNYTDDGTAATSSAGMPVTSGTCFAYSGPLSALSFTAQSGSPTLSVLYYKAN